MEKVMKLFTCLLILSAASMANARVRHIPIKDIPGKSDFIIAGRVLSSKTRWDKKKVMIFTDYKIKVEENILGKSPSQIVMSFAGGTVGEKTISVSGTPALETGKTYILFGYDNNKYSVPVVGHEQGVFRIERDLVENKDYVVDYHGYLLERLDEQNVARGPLVELDSKGALTERKPAINKKMPVSPKPVVRNASGKIIDQDSTVFKKPRSRKRGVSMEKSMFIKFIKSQIH